MPDVLFIKLIILLFKFIKLQIKLNLLIGIIIRPTNLKETNSPHPSATYFCFTLKYYRLTVIVKDIMLVQSFFKLKVKVKVNSV